MEGNIRNQEFASADQCTVASTILLLAPLRVSRQHTLADPQCSKRMYQRGGDTILDRRLQESTYMRGSRQMDEGQPTMRCTRHMDEEKALGVSCRSCMWMTFQLLIAGPADALSPGGH